MQAASAVAGVFGKGKPSRTCLCSSESSDLGRRPFFCVEMSPDCPKGVALLLYMPKGTRRRCLTPRVAASMTLSMGV